MDKTVKTPQKIRKEHNELIDQLDAIKAEFDQCSDNERRQELQKKADTILEQLGHYAYSPNTGRRTDNWRTLSRSFDNPIHQMHEELSERRPYRERDFKDETFIPSDF